MGRRGFCRTKKLGAVEKRIRPNTWSQDPQDGSGPRITVIDKHNEAFSAYYKHQKIVADDEWDAFYDKLKEALPTTFRVVENTLHTEYVLSVVEKAQTDFPDVVRRLNWYPGFAYEVNVSRARLRSVESLRGFHRFLVHQSEAGTIYRQEVVSMVPALFVPLTDHSRILDMCAAPGSKTSQLLERMQRFKGGVVIANDACSRRGHMLIHHLRHLDSASLIVTNHSAQLFPNVFVEKENEELARMQYSAILCDVPCSGDGTLRKSEIMWRDWETYRSSGLHRLQLSILRRAVELCEVGGTVVYSTCSFNPLENEAVVNAALASSPGCLELQDCEAIMKDFPHRSGMLDWGVLYRDVWYDRMEDVPNTPLKLRQTIVPTMFPQCRTTRHDLTKCLRFFPHLSNTGGFFVAVLKKLSDVHWVRIPAPPAIDGVNTSDLATQSNEKDQQISSSPQEKLEDVLDVGEHDVESLHSSSPNDQEPTQVTPTNQNAISRENLYKPQTDFVSLAHLFADEATTERRDTFWHKLGEAYGFNSVSEEMWKRLLVRVESSGCPRKVWLTTAEGAAVLHARFRRPLKVLSAGCLLFDGKHSDHFRITSSGARWLTAEGWGPKTLSELKSDLVAAIEPELMLHLLRETPSPAAETDGRPRRPDEVYRHRLETLVKYKGRFLLEKLPLERPCLLVFHLAGSYGDIPVPAWRGKTNIQLLLDTSTRFAVTQLILHALGEPVMPMCIAEEARLS